MTGKEAWNFISPLISQLYTQSRMSIEQLGVFADAYTTVYIALRDFDKNKEVNNG